jgi:transposase
VPASSRCAKTFTEPRGGPQGGKAQLAAPWPFRSEAAFAMSSGAAPISVSFGLTNRHRINRSGDRQLNRALPTTVLTRAPIDPTTQAYIARRTTEGNDQRD